MEPISTVIISGVIYDMLKHSISITGSNIKTKLREWVIDDAQSEKLATAINSLDLNDEMGEKAINKQLMSSNEVVTLLSQIQPSNIVITQSHSGTGDNVAGNKIINK
ncbi:MULTISPECIES: hypothetical protein [unclassified Methylophaga]|nr:MULTISPECIES: hypothetical protein [unclassified Methylophaga]MAK67576.1 hypothetical protein [Methylophaga sp.]MAY18810.1 hypothetical protein [Methylophaga sp.]HCD05047.1 hypothetical protein [Methylophaga sp.]